MICSPRSVRSRVTAKRSPRPIGPGSGMEDVMKRHTTARALLVAAVLLVVGLASREALAFRMIQNNGVGRFSAGAAVRCDDAGGFTHWNNANISFAHNTGNQGAGKGTAL